MIVYLPFKGHFVLFVQAFVLLFLNCYCLGEMQKICVIADYKVVIHVYLWR